MKKLFVVSVFLFSLTSFAQSKLEHLDKEIRADKEYKKEVTVLKLSSVQEEQYLQITKKYLLSVEDVRELNIPSEEVRKKEDVLELQKAEELQKILNESQFAKYKEIAAEKITAYRSKKRY